MSDYTPMLAAQGDAASLDLERYVYQFKVDGSRMLAYLNGDHVRLVGRSGIDYTHAFPEIVKELARIQKHVVLDGEIVVLNKEGIPAFPLLAQRIHLDNKHRITFLANTSPATYMIFDILEIDGKDLTSTGRQWTFSQRFLALRELFETSDRLQPIPTSEKGSDFFAEAISRGYEGIVAKNAYGFYRQGKRHPDWLKVKASHDETFVIVGLTKGTGWRESTFGALMLAREHDGKLTYAGEVGTGFDQVSLAQVLSLTNRLRIQTPTISVKTDREVLAWVKPSIKVDIKYFEKTEEKLRFPVFMKVRAFD